MRIDIGTEAKRLLEMMEHVDRNLETWGHGITEIDEHIAKKELWDYLKSQVEMLAEIPNNDNKIVFYGDVQETVRWMMAFDVDPSRVLSAVQPQTLKDLDHIPSVIVPLGLTVTPQDIEKFRQTDEQIKYLVRIHTKED